MESINPNDEFERFLSSPSVPAEVRPESEQMIAARWLWKKILFWFIVLPAIVGLLYWIVLIVS